MDIPNAQAGGNPVLTLNIMGDIASSTFLKGSKRVKF